MGSDEPDGPVWRCVTTGIEADGREVVRLDAPLSASSVGHGPWRGPVISIDGPRATLDDGTTEPLRDEPAPGSAEIEALAAERADIWLIGPGQHQPEAVEAYLVVAGTVVVDLGGPSTTLRPCEVFVPRGRAHTVRTVTGGARLLAIRLHLDPAAPLPESLGVQAQSGNATRVRRVVAGTDLDGRPVFVQDGDPGRVFVMGDPATPDVALSDVWELGGAPTSSTQGGDPVDPYALEPQRYGAKVLCCELKPTEPTPGAEGWHATATIDVDVIVQGSVVLHLPDAPPVELHAGDIVLQRGTTHRWAATGDEQLKMLSVMLGVESAAERSAGH